MTGAGVLLLSPDALLIRLIKADQWTVLFWRAFLSALSLTLLVALMSKGRLSVAFRSIGRGGLGVALCMAFASTFFVTAITHTTTANALVIISTGPLFAAFLTWIFLGERPKRITWIVAVVVVIAIGAIFAGALRQGSIGGDLAALGAALAHASALTTARHTGKTNMMPALALGGIGASLIALCFGVAVPSPSDVPLLLVLGCVVVPGAITLVFIGPRYLPAPEVSLITRLEALLGPLWVWIVVGESPSGRALASGIVIFLMLVIHTMATGFAVPTRAS